MHELKSKLKKAIRDSGDTCWEPWVAFEIKKFLPDSFSDYLVVNFELAEEKQPKAQSRRLELAAWLAAWDGCECNRFAQIWIGHGSHMNLEVLFSGSCRWHDVVRQCPFASQNSLRGKRICPFVELLVALVLQRWRALVWLKSERICLGSFTMGS